MDKQKIIHASQVLILATWTFSAPLTAGEPEAAPQVSSVQIKGLIQQLGAVKFSDREKAQKDLIALGVQAVAHLQKAAREAKDSEVKLRAQELLKQMIRFGLTGKLGKAEQEVVGLPIQTKILKGGKIASIKNFTYGEYGIVEIGMIRVAILNHVRPGHTSGSQMAIRGIKPDGKDRGSMNNTFSYKYGQGRTECSLGSLAFQVEEGFLVFGARKLSLNKKFVVLASENGQVMKIIGPDSKLRLNK